ncbi:MAG: hypothetical protein QG604_697 [Candidatus Dependentiae bacterium]|nr:hypothetical protein [Candidatus Dependentiae bacterium]
MVRRCKVGVIFGLTHQFHCAVADSIRRFGSENRDFSISCLNMPLTQEAIREKVLKLILSKDPYDVLVPIGLRAGIYLKTVLDELGGYPTIFTGGDPNPLAHNLVESFEAPGGLATAVVRDPVSSTMVAEKLALLSPYLNKIILPYWPLNAEDTLHNRIADTVQYFTSRGIVVDPVQITDKDEVIRVLRDKVRRHDAVLLPEAGSGAVHHEAAYLCWERNALLCADSFESIDAGASCAIGGNLYAFGNGVGRALSAFFYEKKPMGLIPVIRIPNDRIFIVNIAMLQAIGLPIGVADIFNGVDGVMVVKKWVRNPMEGVSYGR